MRTPPDSLLVQLLWLLLLQPAAASACWNEAGQRHGVSPSLLQAMAQVESGLDASALNLTHRASTGSYDIGLMQINSSNLPALKRHGVSEADLFTPCTNIHVGAWLLAQAFARHGVTWEAVGAYNASCSQLKGEACRAARSRYAWSVYHRLTDSPAAARAPSPIPAHAAEARRLLVATP